MSDGRTKGPFWITIRPNSEEVFFLVDPERKRLPVYVFSTSGLAGSGAHSDPCLATLDALIADGYVAGATVGILQGVWRTVLRGVVGVFEVVTFPAEIPKGFKPILKPEFAFGQDVWKE